jgi:hypothetical protein
MICPPAPPTRGERSHAVSGREAHPKQDQEHEERLCHNLPEAVFVPRNMNVGNVGFVPVLFCSYIRRRLPVRGCRGCYSGIMVCGRCSERASPWKCGSYSAMFGDIARNRSYSMSEAKEIANKVVAEVKDSAHLFFTPVRVIVSEFNKGVQTPTTNPNHHAVMQFGAPAPDALAKAHDGVAVNAGKALSGANALAFGQAGDDCNLLIAGKVVHGGLNPRLRMARQRH